MPIDSDAALEMFEGSSDAWFAWRVARLKDGSPEDIPSPPAQDPLGGFIGASGRVSPGATGEALCHFVILGAPKSGPAVIALDHLNEMQTPAGAWLDPPDAVPGDLDDPGGARVWATAAACCGLAALGVDPGERAFTLLRGDTDQGGRFLGGAYPTFAGAAAFWLREGPKTEIAEWALRWVREMDDDDWGPWERATALTFWGAAGIPAENLTVELFLETLRAEAPTEGWPDDPGLTLRTLEVLKHYGAT